MRTLLRRARRTAPRLVCLLAALATSSAVRAQDASTSEPDCVAWIDPNDTSVAHADWTYTADGEVLPELQIAAVDAQGVTYAVELRARFGADEVTWTLGPWSADDAETLIVPVVIPDEAYFDPDQGVYLTDLIAHVLVTDSTGTLRLQTVGAPPLRLVWPGEALEPVLLDEESAATLAPSGVYGEPARLAALRAHEDAEDGNVEYGPAL